jgi:homoserine O-acetyltransferase
MGFRPSGFPTNRISMTDDQRFGLSRHVTLPGPLRLDGGVLLSPVDIAYETYGTLAPDGSNAILICHALTGDQYVASDHPITGKPGWWTRMVGPGKPIDPARHFVVCANVLGSCMGSSGPATVNPATGQPWAMSFPVITIRDMVRAQAMLLDHLGVGTITLVGGSMGGMQALSWAATFPDRVTKAVVIASTARHTAQNIAFHEVGRQAIMADPNWRGGAYYGAGDPPAAGLAVARMAAHITYLSEAGLTEKFGRRLQAREAKSFGFDADFQVESYLRHQGLSFTDRFDANSYLYITRAMDYFDLAEEHGGLLANAFKGVKTRFALVSFDTDWLYPTPESRAIVHALNAAGAAVSFVELSSPFGHDAFLLDSPELNRVVDGFLRAAL